MHSPIILKNVSLTFSQQTCFENFSTHIHAGSRIGIIGRNGSGKSSLLKIIQGSLTPSSGTIIIAEGLTIAYVEQTIDNHATLSGGQRFNKRLSAALAQLPDVLLLDEPTNHLDKTNRTSLLRMINHFQGTLIIVSHDTELLRSCISTLWHIADQAVHEFSGSYDDYMQMLQQQQTSLHKELNTLKRAQKTTHDKRMKEQKRAAKSKQQGEKSRKQKKWTKAVSKAKAVKAERVAGKQHAAINTKRSALIESLAQIRLPETITPHFSLEPDMVTDKALITIRNGTVGYTQDSPILTNITFTLSGKERVALQGNNGSGKSTLLKAIMRNKTIFTTGDWHLPQPEEIGYLDQHYATLRPTKTVVEHIHAAQPDWDDNHVRRHLNDFLFRKPQEVQKLAQHLSGGEKARLSLSIIAARTPRLLILDEITNNLDLETKAHVAQVLQSYPGAMIIISHDTDFVDALGIDHTYTIADGMLT